MSDQKNFQYFRKGRIGETLGANFRFCTRKNSKIHLWGIVVLPCRKCITLHQSPPITPQSPLNHPQNCIPITLQSPWIAMPNCVQIAAFQKFQSAAPQHFSPSQKTAKGVQKHRLEVTEFQSESDRLPWVSPEVEKTKQSMCTRTRRQNAPPSTPPPGRTPHFRIRGRPFALSRNATLSRLFLSCIAPRTLRRRLRISWRRLRILKF